MSVLDLINNSNLVTQSRVTELANAITDEQRKQINYQLICSALEKAIVEIYAQYPNSEVTNDLRNKVNNYLAELQIVLQGRN
mgnify:CR=1 FL=1|jgi:hypothetical protein|tara:strand:+ start:186 stop:431 length:246 start_codon:yes stop_codon:yes gene_type:complete